MLGLNSTLGFLLSLGLFTSDTPKIIVETEFGKLEGTTSTSREGRTVYEFLGIPFAVPPINDLRFRPPKPWNTSWEGVRDAKEYGSKCTQFHLIGKFISGKEDCLYLNVYTHQYRKEDDPPLEEETLRPVIVYFHGGLFMHGSGQYYKPMYFLDEEVVLVSVNYRLGILGFLNLGTEDIRGNQGLKDQAEALRWIQRNIRNFGGNPNLVTIMGESAGAASVHYHILSPVSKGLFHRAISQSGNVFVSWASMDNPQEQALLFAEQLNCMKPTMTKIAKCLRNVDAEKIAKSQRAAADILHHRYALFAPTIEIPSADAFLSEPPENVIRSGNFSKVPWLVGVNDAEGLIYSAPILRNETIRQELNKNWTTWVPILFRFSDEPNKKEIAEKIRTYYLGNSTAEINMARLHDLTLFLSDRSFFEGLHNSLMLHRGKHPIYPYVYAYEGRFSFARLLFSMTFALPVAADVVVSRSWKWFKTTILRQPEPSYGVAHGDELPLMFNLPFQSELKEGGKTFGDYDMSQRLIKTWTAFARDGVPPPIDDVNWPLLTSESSNDTTNILHANFTSEPGPELIQQLDSEIPMKFIRINKTCEIVDEPFHPRRNFWKELNLLPFKIENATTASKKTLISLPTLCEGIECVEEESTTTTTTNINATELENVISDDDVR